MAQIDYYLTATSPFVYLAGTRPAEIAAARGAGLTYRPLDSTALLGRTGGVPPADRHPARQAYRRQELRRLAARWEMPIELDPPHWPTNPAPSSYAIIAAQQAGGGDLGALVAALSSACWAEGADIAADDVIRDRLSNAGFDPGLADSGLLAGAEAYGANLEAAAEAGAFGVPFFVTDDDERFWGPDRLNDLDRHLAGGA